MTRASNPTEKRKDGGRHSGLIPRVQVGYQSGLVEKTEQRPPPRLTDILSALPSSELAGLIKRLGIRIDRAKRLDPPSQVARVLVSLPDLRDTSRLPQASVELMHRVAESCGALVVDAVPSSLEPLAARGLMFARAATSHGRGKVELLMPAAYVVQLRTWEGEDPRGLRALLAQAPFEALTAIAGHYLGRTATPPVSLSLESAWEVLSDRAALATILAEMPSNERRVLEGVADQGGEVDTEELLELEREPLRIRTASGATPSRRGIGFALERRGLLVPVHPNRHIVPTQVMEILNADRYAERAKRREQVRTFVLSGDHAPRRARFSHDPTPLALAMAMASREPGHEAKPGLGTPKSVIAKLATRFGRDPQQVALLVALSRALGLWDPSALSTSAPPGALPCGPVSEMLFRAWVRGGAWDEARPEPEVLRLPPEQRDTSPVGALRDLVLEALQELGEDRWIPWPSLEGYLRTDERIAGIGRLLRRWAERVGIEAPQPLEIAERIVLESLPALGIVDLGEAERTSSHDLEDEHEQRLVTLRLTPRGRAVLSSEGATVRTSPREPSAFLDPNLLRVGPEAKIHQVLGLVGFVDIGGATDALELIVAPHTLSRALSLGFEADAIRQRIEGVAAVPEALARTLTQASVVVGTTSFVTASGFLWVEDASVRELLRTRKSTQELFVDPSPPGGLLVGPHIDLERLSRRCRTVGVEILHDGEVVRARTLAPPTTGGSGRYAKVSKG